MKELKQVIGVDVAQDELVVTFGRLLGDLSIDFIGHKVFKNNEKGFKALIDWVMKLVSKPKEVHYVMEATGVYHHYLQ